MNRKKSSEGLVSKWNGKFSRAVKDSLPVRTMVRFGELEERSDKGFFVSRIKKMNASLNNRFGLKEKIVRPARVAFSREMEQSAMIYLINGAFERLLSASLRSYGVFLLTFVFYSVLLAAGRGYFSGGEWFSLSWAIKSTVSFLIPMPLLFTAKDTTLATGLLQSRIFSALLFDLLGLEREFFEKKRTPISGVLLGFLLGMALFFLTIFIPVKYVVSAVFWLLFAGLAYVRPESAMLLLCLCLPFSTGIALRGMLIVVAFFFAVKLLRGKRNLKMGVFLVGMLVYAGYVLFGGLVTPAGVGFWSAGNYLVVLAAFFLPALLFLGKSRILSASRVLTLGASVAACSSALVFLYGFVPERYREFLPVMAYLEESPFFSIDFCGIFVVFALPVFVARLISETGFGNRFLSVSLIVLFAAVAILSRDSGVWIAFLLVLALMRIFERNVSVFSLTSVACASGLLYVFFMPETVKDAVSAYCNGFSADLSLSASTFMESASRAFAGLGVGSAQSGGNLYARLLTDQGLVGILLLAFVLIGVLCYAVYASYTNESVDRGSAALTGGFAAALIGALVLGVFTDLFADERVTVLFFFIGGVLFACAKNLCTEGAQSVHSTEVDRDYLFIPMIRREKKKKKERRGKKAVKRASEGEENRVDDFTPVQGEGEPPVASDPSAQPAAVQNREGAEEQ